MNLIIATAIIVYFIISLYFVRNWLKFFKSSSTPTPENSFLSLLILITITVSWPFVLPLYLIMYGINFMMKWLFTPKLKNTYCDRSITAFTFADTNVYKSEKVKL